MARLAPSAPLAALLLAACASAPPVKPWPGPNMVAPPQATAPVALATPARPPAPRPPPDPAEVEARLTEAARLLSDGASLERVEALLASVPASAPGRDLRLGQLAELRGDDEAAALAYGRALAQQDDEEVRLRRALALERLGRGDEVAEELARLRRPPAEGPVEPAPVARTPNRKLRPLLPSSR